MEPNNLKETYEYIEKNYGIDVKEQIKEYDLSKFDFNEKNRSKVKKNGIR